MELGVHVSNFTWEGGTPQLAATLGRLAREAEQAGVARITVMDHVWQIGAIGPPEHEMLEAYTTLGYLAASTERVRLHALVTGVVYRSPGLLAKIATTLDVLSGGRAILGLGAAWNEEEARGLGLAFPPLAERFERLEETLQIIRQMWSGEDGPYAGAHYRLERTLSSPQPLTAPHPPIMVGGAGERRTLRLVAQYADACNLFANDEAAHKLAVLREHCERLGRDYDSIEKTVLAGAAFRGGPEALVEQLRKMHELGFSCAYVSLPGPAPLARLEELAQRVVPQIAAW